MYEHSELCWAIGQVANAIEHLAKTNENNNSNSVNSVNSVNDINDIKIKKIAKLIAQNSCHYAIGLCPTLKGIMDVIRGEQ